MKFKHIAAVLAGAAALSAPSCDLNEKFYSEVTPDTFFTSPESTYAVLCRPFTHWKWYIGADRWYLQELTTDEMTCPKRGADWYNGGEYYRLHYHTWSPDDRFVVNTYDGTTGGISRALEAKADLESVDYNAIGLSDAVKADHINQLNAITAYFYMKGLDYFGGMPIYHSVNDGLRPRNTALETYRHVETLLKNAIPALAKKSSLGAPEDGYIKQAAAAAMLAQLYFNAEAYIGEEHFDECAQICRDIIGGLYEKVDIAPEPGMNLVGRVTDGKNPIEGAVVSDGFTVTTTDAQGVYQMRVKKSTPFVFVSVPADCEIPVENGMPKIYKKIALGDNDVVQRSFTLERTGKKERFTLLALADVQIGRDDEVVMLEKEVLPLLVPYVQQLDKPVYGISLGDLVWDNMPFHSVYKEQIRKIGVPVFQVIGNHDHDKAIGMDTEADHSFRAAFGPTYYSYNIGDCHFVVLDDVLYTGSSNYTAEITEAQMAWLEQDLKHVPKDKLIIIGVHIATSRRNRPTSHIANYRELYALLDGYNVRILSGHSHNNYTTTISETIEENTLGAVMGAYWNGEELCNDGSPRGYAVYEIEGNRIANWYYKGTAYPKEYQMYLYGPGQAVSEQYRDGLIFNIFNWHSTWTVEVREDDAAWTTLPSGSNLKYEMDRRAYDFMYGDTKPEHRPTAEPETNNDHMFYYEPSSATWSEVTVKASDPYGNVYTESIRNE